MPVVGFIDDAGSRVKFADISRGRGRFDGLPRPFLRALAAGYRGSDHYGAADVVSVTTLGQPVQQVRLLQRHDVYVEPLRSMWATFGTLGHAMFEGHTAEDDIAERRLVIDFEGQLVGGTFDLLEMVDGERVGRDYKITSAYGVSKMVAASFEPTEAARLRAWYRDKPDYLMQANVYRYMLARPDALEVVKRDGAHHGKSPDGQPVLEPFEHAGIGATINRWQLVAWARDWQRSKHDGSVKPVEMIDVPLIATERVENYLRQRILVYKAAEMCDDAGLPACTRDETWGGKRCASWCDAASVCPQLKRGRRS